MKYFIFILFIIFSLSLKSCSEFLSEESENSITAASLYSSPETIERALIAIYAFERELNNWGGESIMGRIMRCDQGTDIILAPGGADAAITRLLNLNSNNTYVNQLWRLYYQVIGRANEIIYYGNQLGEPAQKSIAEASFWRAYCYYTLFTRFSRVVLITEPTTKDNYQSIPKTPADSIDLFNLLYNDCDMAINYLDLSPPGGQAGRATKGTARHLKSLIAAWARDWDEVASQVNAIESSAIYYLLANPKDVFQGADLNHPESIFVAQWANATGGGVGGTNRGHRFAQSYQTIARNLPGMLGPNGEIYTVENGGAAWGRAFPNSYLLSLYDKNNDKRFRDYYQHYWKYTSQPSSRSFRPGVTATIGDTIRGRDLLVKPDYRNIHPMVTKFVDVWTKTPDISASYKDYIIYRVAQTYLLGAEAYVNKFPSNQDSARYYYNKTWVRAGNSPVTSDISNDMIRDEMARELAFEGHRFEYLKRTNQFFHQVSNYGGDFTTLDQRAYGDRDPAFAVKPEYPDFTGTTTTVDIRFNIQSHHINWPIPQSQIDAMGADNFPQNPFY